MKSMQIVNILNYDKMNITESTEPVGIVLEIRQNIWIRKLSFPRQIGHPKRTKPNYK